MDRYFRYLNLFRAGKFGLSLPQHSLSNYLKIRLGRIEETVGSGTTSFPVVSFFAAFRCNLKCSFCICSKFPDNWRDYEMTPDKMRRILEFGSVQKSLMTVFTGGEPTLNKDLPEIMRMCRERKHLVGMISNGILLDGLAPELAKAGLCDAQISVYENTKGKLASILPNVTPHFAVNASYVLLKSKLLESQKKNFEDLLDVIRMCKESGCASIKMNLYQAPDGDSDNDEIITNNDDVYNQFIAACKARLKKVHFEGYMRDNSLPSPRFTVFFPTPPDFTAKRTSVRGCRIPWNLGTFDALGTYGFCCGPRIRLEHNNIFENDEQVINCATAVRIRKCLIDESIPLEPECASCVYLNGSYISSI